MSPRSQRSTHEVLHPDDRPSGRVRDIYEHTACRRGTVMGQPIAQTVAADPSFYSHMYCTTCRDYYPIAQFTWPDGSPLGGA